jgi:hypothetical protein
VLAPIVLASTVAAEPCVAAGPAIDVGTRAATTRKGRAMKLDMNCDDYLPLRQLKAQMGIQLEPLQGPA